MNYDFVAEGRKNALKRWEGKTEAARLLTAAKASYFKIKKKDALRAREWVLTRFGESRGQQYIDEWEK